MKDWDAEALFDLFLTYFRVQEIVGPTCYQQYKHKGNHFFLSRFNPRLLATMIYIRVNLDKKITINNWLWGGSFDERGLRDNLSDIVKKKKTVYLSGHVMGAAFDFDVEGMTAVEVRNWLESVAADLPYKIRLEDKLRGKPISWVHLDVFDEPKNPKVYRFNV